MNEKELKELKGQVKKYIDDLADAEVVKMVHALLKNYAEAEWWDNMSDALKTDLDESIYGTEKEETMTYEQVKRDYPHWFMN